MGEIKKISLGYTLPKRVWGRSKNNPQVYTTQEGIKEIKNKPQVYTTQEGLKEIKSTSQIYSTRECIE